MRKLVTATTATVVVYGAFHLHAAPPPPALDWIDDVWITLVVGTFTLAALVMLLPRIPWTWRGVGVFLTTLGTAALYGALLETRHDDDPVGGIPEWWADVIRALYVVGGPLLLYGLLDWLGDWWREIRSRQDSPDGIDRTGTGPVAATVHPRRRASDWTDNG